MRDAPNVEGEGYYAKISHSYHVIHKTSYNPHSSDLIGTDSLYDCMAWWSEPLLVSHCLITFSVWLEPAVNVPFHQVT